MSIQDRAARAASQLVFSAVTTGSNPHPDYVRRILDAIDKDREAVTAIIAAAFAGMLDPADERLKGLLRHAHELAETHEGWQPHACELCNEIERELADD